MQESGDSLRLEFRAPPRRDGRLRARLLLRRDGEALVGVAHDGGNETPVRGRAIACDP